MIRTPEDPCQIEFVSRADLIIDEPLVKTVGDVVSGLDLSMLYCRYSEAGCSFYDPSMMLKILFFGYCDGVRSCRDLARHIRYDIRYRFFCGSLRPDFRTINRFRKDNLDLLSDYFAQIVLMCQESGLLDTSLLALDGSKLRASSSCGRTVRKQARDKLAAAFRIQLGDDIAADNCADELPSGGDTTGSDSDLTSEGKVNPDEGRVTDPDARFMKTSEGGKRPCYNSQIVVDKHQVIVAADVSNNADDSVQFQSMVEQCRQIVGKDLDKVTADGGYYSGNNLQYADSLGIDLYLPVSNNGRVPDDRFHRDAFVYDKQTDSYQCPAGERLYYRRMRKRKGVASRIYSGSATSCGCCKFHSKCTKKRVRELQISENYGYELKMKAKLRTEQGRLIYNQRKCLVEPVFGNIKFNLGYSRFVLRTLKKVKAEFLLMCIAHNLKKLAAHGSKLSPTFAAKIAVKMLISLLLTMRRSPLAAKWRYLIHFSNIVI